MRKIKENETYLEFYNDEKNKTDVKIIIYIINSAFMLQYNNQSLELQKQIVDFVTILKKENKELLFSLKDLPIFKTYDIIITKQMDNMHKKINYELSPFALAESQKLSKQIFDFKIDFAYSVTIDDKSYMYYGSSQKSLEKDIKILFHNENGVIIFYISINNKNIAFGFQIGKNSIKEIEAKTLKKFSTKKDIDFATFDEVKECIKLNG